MLKQSKTYNQCMRADYAINERIKEEEKLYNADFYDKKMKMLGINADWFEKNKKMEVAKTKKINDNTIRKELSFTSKEIKIRRRQRLHELYLAELSMYENELSNRGLAIVKER